MPETNLNDAEKRQLLTLVRDAVERSDPQTPGERRVQQVFKDCGLAVRYPEVLGRWRFSLLDNHNLIPNLQRFLEDTKLNEEEKALTYENLVQILSYRPGEKRDALERINALIATRAKIGGTVVGIFGAIAGAIGVALIGYGLAPMVLLVVAGGVLGLGAGFIAGGAAGGVAGAIEGIVKACFNICNSRNKLSKTFEDTLRRELQIVKEGMELLLDYASSFMRDGSTEDLNTVGWVEFFLANRVKETLMRINANRDLITISAGLREDALNTEKSLYENSLMHLYRVYDIEQGWFSAASVDKTVMTQVIRNLQKRHNLTSVDLNILGSRDLKTLLDQIQRSEQRIRCIIQ